MNVVGYVAIGYFALVTLFVLLVGSLVCALRDRAYRSGYSKGRTEADKWWIETDAAVDQARKRIMFP